MREIFGPYELIERVAVGGMAEIFRAKRLGVRGFEKIYAVKRLHPRYSQDEDFIEMLVDEARITVQLTHPNIGQTIDLGEIEGHYFILMDFIDGRDLYRVLKRLRETNRQMSIEATAFIAMEACQGLQYAHDKKDAQSRPLKIVHRDVSPQNVIVSFEGEVKLIDFGIAKAAVRAYETEAGIIKGKFYYMSPEQARGEVLDHRTDIFSLGIVLYEMVTGELLYKDDDEVTLLSQVRRADIKAPSLLRPDIPSRFEQIIMRALARDRSDRYAHAGQMRRELERFLRSYDAGFDRLKLSKVMHSLWAEEIEPRRAETDGSIRAVDFAAEGGNLDPLASFEDGGDPTALEDSLDGQEESLLELGSDVLEIMPDSVVSEPSGQRSELATPGEAAQSTLSSADDSEDFFDNEPTMAFDREQAASLDHGPSLVYRDEPSAKVVPPPPAKPAVVPAKPMPLPQAEVVDFNSDATSMLSEEEMAESPAAWEADSGRGARIPSPVPKQSDRSPPGLTVQQREWLVFGGVLLGIVVLTAVLTGIIIGDEPTVKSNTGDVITQKTANQPKALGRIGGLQTTPGLQNAVLPKRPPRAILELRTRPSRAYIEIDGKKLAQERTPTSIPVDPGRPIRIRLSLPKFETYETEYTLSPQETRPVVVELKPLSATIRVESQPTGAVVFINGSEVGRSTITVPSLPVDGVYLVRVTKDGYRPHEETVSWTGASRGSSKAYRKDVFAPLLPVATIPIKIEPRVRETAPRVVKKRRRRPKKRRQRPQARSRGFGKLNVHTSPWASVLIDGRLAARESPLFGHSLSTGSHRVKACFKNDRSNCETKRVTIERGKTTLLKFRGRSR
jgi:serine/threonine protein kinase